MPEYKYIPIEQLVEPESPIRVSMDEEALASLAESIKNLGVLQPLLVVAGPTASGAPDAERHAGAPAAESRTSPRYEIVAGHRRYKACIMANLNAVPCLIFADMEIAKYAALIAENSEREAVSPAEEAIWFDDLIKKYDFTEEQLLSTVRRSANYVYERLALFNGNEAVFHALKDKQINMAVAKQLNRCKDAEHTVYLLGLAIQGGATAHTVSKWVSEHNVSRGESPTVAASAPLETQPAPAVVSDERLCILCRRGHQALNLVPVWVHDWELRDLNERMDNAAAVDVEPSTSTKGD